MSGMNYLRIRKKHVAHIAVTEIISIEFVPGLVFSLNHIRTLFICAHYCIGQSKNIFMPCEKILDV